MKIYRVVKVHDRTGQHRSTREPEVGDLVKLASFRQEGKTTVWCIEINNEYTACFKLSMLEEQK